MKPYICQKFKSGKDYLAATGMEMSTTWASEVELFACAQLTGKDVFVYTKNAWQRYACNPEGKQTKAAFYLSNVSGDHFNAVIGMM